VQPEYGAMYCIAARFRRGRRDDDRVGHRAVSSSLRTTLAIVEAFCPIATYTQMRSLPFWLMIVSTATAVLPVWRSPMMSSRWPRPIGTIASMAFRPVCTGCVTDWRAITPGATFSMTSVIFALTGPCRRSAGPSELTTRPMSSGRPALEDAAGALDRVAFGDVLVLAEHHRADESRSRLAPGRTCCPGTPASRPASTSTGRGCGRCRRSPNDGPLRAHLALVSRF
jgi:hypothetical protein